VVGLSESIQVVGLSENGRKPARHRELTGAALANPHFRFPRNFEAL
jgi:hypothetical protein